MKDDNLITSLMIKSHLEIDKNLKLFVDKIGNDFEEMRALFLKFREIINQHFLTEEQAIFSFCEASGYKYDGISNLIHQHNLMLEMLDDINNDISLHKWPDIAELRKLIKKHREIEEGVLYPRMDVELDDNQKRFIIKKIENFSKIK